MDDLIQPQSDAAGSILSGSGFLVQYGTPLLLLLCTAVCLLHLVFSSGISAMRHAGNGLGEMEGPHMPYLIRNRRALRRKAYVECTLFTAVLQICAYFLAYTTGLIWYTRSWIWAQTLNRGILLLLLPGLAALLLALLVEGIARGIGRRNAQAVLRLTGGAVRIMAYALLPVYAPMCLFDTLIGGKHRKQEPITEETILRMLDSGGETGAIEEQQGEMIRNIFEFDDTPVSAVMTHRREIAAVEVSMSMAEAVDYVVSEQYSRLPVYADSIDNILGILNAKDLLGLIGKKDISGFSIQRFLRETLFVPETAKCDDVLSEMLHKKIQLAVIVDEYGGTAGIVCMEDILEEIVGNIQDEYDDEESDVHHVTDNIYIIQGDAAPADVFEVLLPHMEEIPDFDTMNGFLVDQLGRIPEATERAVVEWQHIRFTVLRTRENCIEKIKAELLPEQET